MGTEGRKINRERANAYAKKYREEKLDPVEQAAYQSKWRSENKDRIKAIRSTPEYREKENKRRRERYAADPDFRAKNHGSRWTFSADLTYQQLVDIRSQDCFYCGGPGGTADHLIPRYKGGQDRLDNLVPSCLKCNLRKGTSDLADFYKRSYCES